MSLQAEKNLEPYLTIPELVKRGTIPLGETKLYELANRGKVRSYRVGKKIFVLESEIWEDVRKFNMKMVYGKALAR